MLDNRTRVAVAVVPALLALGLRLYDLADKPLWLDEVITYKRALMPWPALVTDSFINKHFPTYFILVRPFDASLINEWTLRLPSAVFGSLAVFMAALIATEVHSRRAGLAAGMLMALSPIDIQFSQEARAYALVSLLILLALWGLVRIGRHAPARGMCAAWIAAVGGTVAALYTLTVAAVWWLAANVAFGVIALNAAAGRARLVRIWLVAQGFIALVWLPVVAVIYRAGGDDPLRGYRWIPPSTWRHVSDVLSSVYLYRAADVTTFSLLPTSLPWLGFVILALALLGAWRLRRTPPQLAAVGLAWVAMPLAMVAISAVHGFWVPRYLLWTTGAFYVLAGIGIAILPWRLFAPALAALLAAGLVNIAPYYTTETKPRWDLAATYLAAHAGRGDAVVAAGYQATYVLGAYAARAHLAAPIVDGGDVVRTAASLPKDRPVWLLYGRTGQSPIPSESDYLRQWSRLGAPAETVHFGRYVVAWRFGPPAH